MKSAHPEFGRIGMYAGWCPMCSAVKKLRNQFGTDQSNSCSVCPIAEVDQGCEYAHSVYSEWDALSALDEGWSIINQKLAAKRMLLMLSKIYKERYGEEYNPYKKD